MRIPAVSLVLALCVSLAAVLRGADNGDGTYTNPILFADYPAPCAVGGANPRVGTEGFPEVWN